MNNRIDMRFLHRLFVPSPNSPVATREPAFADFSCAASQKALGMEDIMPLNIDIVQILLHMLNFIILAGGLTLLLFKPVVKFLDERKAHYEELEKDIAARTGENEKLKAEYEERLKSAEAEIAAKQAEADKKSAAAVKEAVDSANEKARAIIAAAEEEAEQRRGQILDSAQTEIGELVIEATQKLIGASADAKQSRALYDEFIRQAKG